MPLKFLKEAIFQREFTYAKTLTFRMISDGLRYMCSQRICQSPHLPNVGGIKERKTGETRNKGDNTEERQKIDSLVDNTGELM